MSLLNRKGGLNTTDPVPYQSKARTMTGANGKRFARGSSENFTNDPLSRQKKLDAHRERE